MKTTINDRLFQKSGMERPITEKPKECGPDCTCYRFGPCPKNCPVPKAKSKRGKSC